MFELPYDDYATTDFEEWLEDEAPCDISEAIELRDAVRSEDYIGRYAVERVDHRLAVQGSGPQILIIASDDAKSLFLQIIHQKYIAKRRRA